MKTFDKDELRRRVDEVLYYVWDPIGVNDEPCARSEYENYVPQVLKLLEQHETSAPISLYLANIMKSDMEEPADKEKCDYVRIHGFPLLCKYWDL